MTMPAVTNNVFFNMAFSPGIARKHRGGRGPVEISASGVSDGF
jgi:hypothetical protein